MSIIKRFFSLSSWSKKKEVLQPKIPSLFKKIEEETDIHNIGKQLSYWVYPDSKSKNLKEIDLNEINDWLNYLRENSNNQNELDEAEKILENLIQFLKKSYSQLKLELIDIGKEIYTLDKNSRGLDNLNSINSTNFLREIKNNLPLSKAYVSDVNPSMPLSNLSKEIQAKISICITVLGFTKNIGVVINQISRLSNGVKGLKEGRDMDLALGEETEFWKREYY